MDANLDSVRRELADIHDQLLALPADDFAKRSELKERSERAPFIDQMRSSRQP